MNQFQKSLHIVLKENSEKPYQIYRMILTVLHKKLEFGLSYIRNTYLSFIHSSQTNNTQVLIIITVLFLSYFFVYGFKVLVPLVG